MSKGAIVGVGGGTPLNFKVVGGSSEPLNPKENTLWVNTETEITGWVFSAEAPENPAEGMVWILTATNAATSFNALKKNGLRVYPASCKQFEGGAFQTKLAKIYQSGAWKEWRTYVYNEGDECIDLTGGWVVADSSNSTGKKETTLYAVSNGNGTYGGRIRTAKPIDLTNATKLSSYCTQVVGKGALLSVCQYNDLYKGPTATVAVAVLGMHSIDVSALSGSYYVWFSGSVQDGSTARGGAVSQIWLE